MNYQRAKIYSDGSHYIGIPETHRPKRKRKTENEKSAEPNEKKELDGLIKEDTNSPENEKHQDGAKNDATTHIVKDKNKDKAERNRMARMTRLMRKVRLQEWNYFCTFTYDDKKHNEQSFKKSLSVALRHLASRKGWKYIGVWERSPESKRLHFHCIAYIPENAMIGSIEKCNDYDTKSHKMRLTYQNTHFNKRFGRNDFKSMCKYDMQNVIRYLIKYIRKSEEKLVYSRGLPTYFVSDIFEDDVACLYGIDDRKLLLFDNFTCMDSGEIIGKVSPETISKLPKCN